MENGMRTSFGSDWRTQQWQKRGERDEKLAVPHDGYKDVDDNIDHDVTDDKDDENDGYDDDDNCCRRGRTHWPPLQQNLD